MPIDLLKQFYTNLNYCDDFNYLLALLRFHMAPVIHKKKISGLINLINKNRLVKDIWLAQKERIVKFLNLSYFELRQTENSILIIFYRAKSLEKRLRNKNVRSMLEKLGYKNCGELYEYLKVLQKKFTKSCPFEVGVFLGYPLCDIIAFNRDSKNFKCLGYWKCFYNEEKAIRTFEAYDQAKILELSDILQK
ncbi:MAG: DUF3793 family protein [Peptoniphilaceae bacterium]|nr:DUF3793 family protein [Peptoniphilaceae bacterium]MDY6018693.1 DUF3793 family protein [Anaerococcus sp.]